MTLFPVILLLIIEGKRHSNICKLRFRNVLYLVHFRVSVSRSSLDLKVVVKKYYLKKSSLMTNVESSFEKKHGFCFLYVACFLLSFFFFVCIFERWIGRGYKSSVYSCYSQVIYLSKLISILEYRT